MRNQIIATFILIIYFNTLPRAQINGVPDPADAYRPYQLIYVNTHSHSSHSDATGPNSSPKHIVQYNLRRFDAIVLSDHGEHLNPSEWNEQQQLTTRFNKDKICLRGFEITGTAEVQTNIGKNPAYQHGWGHLIVIGTNTFAGKQRLGNGAPPDTLSTFVDFKKWLVRQPGGMAIFCHPNLYMVEESFDGFADPKDTEAAQLVGCELSSHGLRYEGLGDGKSLRSSNEACYRKLLRKHIVSPYMGGDEHTPPYGDTSTVTGMFVKERTTTGILEAMRARRTFATEEPGSLIQLVATTGNQTATMGESLETTNQLIVHVRCMSKFSPVSSIALVYLSAKGSFYDLVQTSQPLHNHDEHWGSIIDQQDKSQNELMLVYAKAKMENGRNLVSAPIWLTQPATNTP